MTSAGCVNFADTSKFASSLGHCQLLIEMNLNNGVSAGCSEMSYRVLCKSLHKFMAEKINSSNNCGGVKKLLVLSLRKESGLMM